MFYVISIILYLILLFIVASSEDKLGIKTENPFFICGIILPTISFFISLLICLIFNIEITFVI